MKTEYQIRCRITRQGGVLKITDKLFYSLAKTGGWKPVSKNRDKKTKGSIRRKALRSLNSLAQRLQRIKDEPHYFMSLILDASDIPKEMEAEVVKAAVYKFLRRVDYRYPSAYYVVVLGWSKSAGIHAHIVTDLGQRKLRKFLSTGQELRKLWMEVISSTNPKTFKLSGYDRECHVSYLTNNKKKREKSVLIHRLNGGKAWTVVNGKYLREAESDMLFIYDEVEREQFNQILYGLLREAGLHKTNFWRIQNDNTCANYLTEELLDEAFKLFRAWKAARCPLVYDRVM